MYLENYPELFKLFLEHAPVAVAMFDRDMRYIATSRRWLTDYCLKEQSLIGRSHYDVFPGISHTSKAIHQRCLAGEVESCQADSFVQPDGSIDWVKWEIRPWYNNQGGIGGIVLFTEVITECKLAETALKESEARFHSLAANLPGMIYQFRRGCDGEVSMPYLSAGCRKLMELEPETIQQDVATLEKLIHPGDRQAFQETLAVSADTLLPWLWEGRIITSSGSLKWVRSISRPSKQVDGDILWDGIIIEITDRVEAQERLKQYQEDLEAKVQQRTQELQKANAQLQGEIAERKQAEAALQQSEVRFQKLAKNIPGMIYQLVWQTDDTQYFSYVSPGCRDIYECEPEEIQQNTTDIFQMFHPEDRRVLQKSIAVSATTLEPVVWEGRLNLPSGKLKWVQAASKPEKQANGDVVWDGLVMDITERKHAEEALRESESKFRSLFEKSADGILLYNGERFIHCNQAAAEMMGCYNKEQLLGLAPSQISPEFQPDGVSSLDKQIAMTEIAFAKGSHRFEWTIRRIDGRDSAVEVLLTAIPLDGDEVFYCVWRDITDRKQAQEALQQSEARYRELANREQLLNNLASQIRNTLDVDTVLETAIKHIHQLLKIDRCSFSWFLVDSNPPSWETIKEARHPVLPSLLGCHSIDKIGPVTDLFLEQKILQIDDVATFAEPMHRQFLESLGIKSEIVLPIKTRSGKIGVIVCGHWSHTRPWTQSEVELLQAVVDQLAIAINQAELYAQSQQAALTAQQQTQQLELTLQELKITQTQLVQSEKMSSLGQLVAGVAHEINNPVNFIYGNVVHASKYIQEILNLLKLYQQEYSQPTPEILEEIDAIDLDFVVCDLPKLLSSMTVGAERIRGIVQSLRTFSRLDEAEMKEVDIHEGIESTLMILQNRLKPKQDNVGIELIKNYGNFPKILCYAGQLNQVFMNLLTNAIDALEPTIVNHKEIYHHQLPAIRISTEVLENQRIAIHIADNGSGMTPDVQKRLFDPFFTTKPVGVGTGLGLSISYQIIVDRHRGQLHCHSELGKGTEFVIEIPMSQSEKT